MNFNLVIAELGKLLLLLAAVFAGISLLGFADGLAALDAVGGGRIDFAAMGALLTAAVAAVLVGGGAVLGTRLARRGTGPGALGRREAILLVVSSWIVGGLLGAVPYLAWRVYAQQAGAAGATLAAEVGLDGIVPCFFESISGLTTTGATILVDIERVPRALLLWRSVSQWIGGLGVVVLFVAILPSLGVGGKKLFMTEVTGPSPEGLRPHVRSTARTLWGFYCLLTAAATAAYMLCGLGWFDAVNHGLTSVATGGFSTRNASIAAFDSVSVEVVAMLFMTLGAISFVLYDRLIKRKHHLVARDPELRLFLGIMAISIVAVAAALLWRGTPIDTVDHVNPYPPGLWSSLRASAFTVVTLMTTTGYATADFDDFPLITIGPMFLLMVMGGCAGSTAGGLKIARIWIAAKQAFGEIEHEYRPAVLRPIRLGRRLVDAPMAAATTSLLLIAVAAVGIGTFLVLLLDGERGIDTLTAFSSCVSAISNFGPGFGQIGMIETYASISSPSQIVLMALMLLGRLEFFAILAVFSLRFWRPR